MPVYQLDAFEDAFGVEAGRDSATGKDFNKDLGAGLDSLILTYPRGICLCSYA